MHGLSNIKKSWNPSAELALAPLSYIIVMPVWSLRVLGLYSHAVGLRAHGRHVAVLAFLVGPSRFHVLALLLLWLR